MSSNVSLKNTARVDIRYHRPGVALCGGSSLLKGLDKYLTVAGYSRLCCRNPVTCTVEGAAKAFDSLDTILRSQNI